ncbi:hypothetical protein SBOR_7356 [Sclerotinia borealis F-4128]|uniref:Uncharacterized protein n=1 Tax=Sclerotinia borealis (strain F-4128) TaxID=1432307 RepID=W9C675_SCLBF|nr:hypothetical protein SBOR_7356 [Sclerotinia borealis F-4128]
MSYHESWGRSCYDRAGFRSQIKFPNGKSRSRPSSTDGPSTPPRGRSDKGTRTYYRSKPAVTSALRCLVGKFEAMDALSLPILDVTLQPAPLHSARNSPRRRGITRDSSQRRLSTILSPTSADLSKDDDVFIDGYMGHNTWGDTPSSTKSTMFGSSKKQFQSRHLRTPQWSVKVAKTPSKSANRIVSSRSTSKHRTITKSERPAYVRPKKSPNKKIGSMIKDRIRFFDGSPDEEDFSSPPKTSPLKTGSTKHASMRDGYHYKVESSPASYATGAPTPVSKAPVGGSAKLSRTSELTRDKSTFPSPAKSQYSPPTSRKQRNVFGEAVQNPFLASQGSSEKTISSTTISPHTSPTKQRPFYRLNSETTADTSPRGRSLARYEVNTTPTRSSDIPKISRPRGRTIPGPKDPKTDIQKDIDTRRDQISEKIEAIYQAKTEERKAQSLEKNVPAEHVEVSPMPKNDGKEDDVRRPQRIKDTSSFRSKSKVADMRMRFDGGASFASPVLPSSASKDAECRIVSPIKKGESSSVIPTPPPAPPPSVFSSRVRGKNNKSVEHMLSIQRIPSPKSPTPRKQTPSQSLMKRVSTLPLEKREKTAVPGRQETPRREILERNSPSPMASQQLEKPALQTWPRSVVTKPKQVKNGLIADKLRMFEEFSKKNEGPVISPGKEKKKETEVDSSKHITSSKIPRTLVDGRKECFEISPVRNGDGDERKLNPVFPMAIVAKGTWTGRDKGKGREDDKKGEEGKMGGETSPAPKSRGEERIGSRGSRGSRLGHRRYVVGKWNEESSMMKGGDEGLAHLPVKRGLRDARMHMGRDGSKSIDWDEVEREIEREGGLMDGELEVLVGRGWGGVNARGEGRDRDIGTSSGRDTSTNRDRDRDIDLNMVVKEAECGLREPKPLRAVEIKRMVEICRDRESSRREREKAEERERSRGRRLERRKHG